MSADDKPALSTEGISRGQLLVPVACPTCANCMMVSEISPGRPVLQCLNPSCATAAQRYNPPTVPLTLYEDDDGRDETSE